MVFADTPAGNTTKTAKANSFGAAGDNRQRRSINWIESDELDNCGPDVQFLNDELQREYDYTHPDRIAFLEDYRWRTAVQRQLGSSESVYPRSLRIMVPNHS